MGSTTYRLSENGLSIVENGQLMGSGWTDRTAYRNDPQLERPGDLGLTEPIDYPDCDGDVVIVTRSFRGAAEAKENLPGLLAKNADWRYLRSDLSCDNFYSPSTEISGGEYIYDTFFTAEHTPDNVHRMCALEESEGYVVERLQDDVLATERLCIE